MHLSYRDPQFWKRFQAQHWEPRVPTVLRQPFKIFPFSEELLLQSMNGFAEGLRANDHRKPCLVSIGDSEKAPRRPIRALFREKSESLEQLEQTCARVFPNQKFGLMVNHMQAVDPGIWKALTSFLQDAYPWISSPPLAFLDLFYGNYSSSFTGLHKDTQEIIAFVIRGKKRILAWPFDYFLSRVKGVTPADKYFNKRLSIDYRKYRKDAIVLDAEPGDVIYWPSDHWHLSEVQNGQFSAMLSLGLFRQKQSNDTEKKLSPFLSQEITGAMTRQDAARQLRWMTSFGFELGGPFADATLNERKEDLGNVRIVKNKSSIVLWKINPSQNRILVASNGHSITLPYSKKLIKLLEQFARGETVTFPRLSDRTHTGRFQYFETNWNKLRELKTRKLISRYDPSTWLVHWLLRVGAVERLISN